MTLSGFAVFVACCSLRWRWASVWAGTGAARWTRTGPRKPAGRSMTVSDLTEQERRDLAYQHRGEVVEGSGVAVEPRQLYPTSDAYEAACAALEKHRARADAAEAELGRHRRAVAEVRTLHVRRLYKLNGGDDWLSRECAACQYEYPCPTLLAIDEAVKP